MKRKDLEVKKIYSIKLILTMFYITLNSKNCLFFFFLVFQNHQKECLYVEIKCEKEGCDVVMKRNDLEVKIYILSN